MELRPTIAFEEPLSPENPRQAVSGLGRYAWVVFTSPTGARRFAEVHRAVEPEGERPRFAAIGQGTARALEAEGFAADRIAEDSRSEGLAAILTQCCSRGERVLLVRPEAARDVLPRELSRAGVDVEAVAFYRTVPAAEAAGVATMVAGGRFGAVVFTSPSSVRCLIQAAGAAADAVRHGLECAKRVAIGAVTAEALASEGLPADGVAEIPTDDAIAAVVERLLRN